MALDAFYDEVTVTKKPKSFGIKIVSSDDIPLDPKKNTAGIVAINMKHDYKISDGVEIRIKKNVPAGYGMGSSAASAAACALGIDALFEIGIQRSQVVFYAGSGEQASAGTVHYDNVAASVYGGFVVVNPYCKNDILLPVPNDLLILNFGGYDTFGPNKKTVAKSIYRPNEVPSDRQGLEHLFAIIAVPKVKIPKQKTKVSRSVIPKTVKFSDAAKNLASAVTMTSMIFSKHVFSEEFVKCIEDVIVEPSRKKMIPGFDKVKENAIEEGADTVTISGAGPSVIAFYEGPGNDVDADKFWTKKIGAAMKKGFKSAKVDCDIVICKPSRGPIIKKRK
jgi:homoserine kinase